MWSQVFGKFCLLKRLHRDLSHFRAKKTCRLTNYKEKSEPVSFWRCFCTCWNIKTKVYLKQRNMQNGDKCFVWVIPNSKIQNHFFPSPLHNCNTLIIDFATSQCKGEIFFFDRCISSCSTEKGFKKKNQTKTKHSKHLCQLMNIFLQTWRQVFFKNGFLHRNFR